MSATWLRYRLFTSAVFHGGLLHAAMNMMAFVPIGGSLERHYGSFKFAAIVLLLIIFGDATYIGLTYLLAFMYVFVQSTYPTHDCKRDEGEGGGREILNTSSH